MPTHLDRESRTADFQKEYESIQASIPNGISLIKLFGGIAENGIAKRSENFKFHEQWKLAILKAEEFCAKAKILKPDFFPDTVHMGAALHPSAEGLQRLYLCILVYQILFYLDDTIGNDLQGGWTPEQRQAVKERMTQFLIALRTGQAVKNPTELEQALLEVLGELRKVTSEQWMEGFAEIMWNHLQLATQDMDSFAPGRKSYESVEEYIQDRIKVGGMNVTKYLMELASKNHVEIEDIRDEELKKDFKRLGYLMEALGALLNDYFSFEKEVITGKTDFNLIPVLAIMYPELGLLGSIYRGAEIINNMADEFFALVDKIHDRCDVVKEPQAAQIHRYAKDCVDCVHASFYWELFTKRYLYLLSIFRETRAEWHAANIGRMETEQSFPAVAGAA